MSMQTEKLSWEGEATIELNSIEYLCNFDCEVEINEYTQQHEPFYSESMQDAMVCLGEFEAECGGKPVHDRNTRKLLRAELINWVEENESKIIKEAK